MIQSENDNSGDLERRADEKASREIQPDRASAAVADAWADLRVLILNVAEAMNRDEELTNRTGGLECEIRSADQIIVANRSGPWMSMTIARQPSSIEIYIKIVIQAPTPLEREQRQLLEVDVRQTGGPFFRNKEGKSWTVDEAAYHILRPFLHLGTRVN